MHRGYSRCELFHDDKRFYEYSHENGFSWISRIGLLDYPFVSRDAKEVSTNKMLANSFVRQRGIKTPNTILSNDIDEINDFISAHKRVVAKPVDGSGSKGLVRDCKSVADISEEILRTPMMFQEFFQGQELRITVCDSKVFSIIRREPPRVVGDGIHALVDLVALENHERNGLETRVEYPQLNPDYETLVLDKMYIPNKGEEIQLGEDSMIRSGASFYGVTNEVDISFHRIAENLCDELNPAFLVVDLLVENYTRSAHVQQYRFLEFNTAPSALVYSSLREGDEPDFVRKIITMIDKVALS